MCFDLRTIILCIIGWIILIIGILIGYSARKNVKVIFYEND